MRSEFTIGLSLSLTGAYAPMGRQAETALRWFETSSNGAGGVRIGAARRPVRLLIYDDRSSAAEVRQIYRGLSNSEEVDLLLGPYSSGLTRAAAGIAREHGRLLINHGGAANDLHSGNSMLVSVLTPASDYLTGFVRLVATLKFWRKRLAIVAAPSPFAKQIAAGVEYACAQRAIRRKRVSVRLRLNAEFDPAGTPARLFPALARNRINALVSAGSYQHDLALMRAVVEADLNLPVLACVAAGVEQFARDLGAHASGIIGPSQWEPDVDLRTELGPAPMQFTRAIRGAGSPCDYVAAQAYAAALIGVAAIESAGSLDQKRIRAALGDLRTTTLFGDFAVDPSGLQVGHKMLLVQWHDGHKTIIDPAAADSRGNLELPPGWRLIAAGFRMLRLSRPDEDDDSDAAPGEDDDGTREG